VRPDGSSGNLVALPLPNFGDGAKGAQSSWAWGISTNSKEGKAAGTFLDYVMSNKIVTAYTESDGAPPGTKTALAASPLYKPGGPLYLFAEALGDSCGTGVLTTTCVAVPRPVNSSIIQGRPGGHCGGRQVVRRAARCGGSARCGAHRAGHQRGRPGQRG
jgi:hypothetical protein